MVFKRKNIHFNIFSPKVSSVKLNFFTPYIHNTYIYIKYIYMYYILYILYVILYILYIILYILYIMYIYQIEYIFIYNKCNKFY